MILLVLAIIALLIFYQLFREFGRTQKIIINMTEEDREKLKNVIEGVIANSSSSQPPESENTKLDKISLALKEKFPDFNPTSFLAKAEEMFDAIFNGFANSHHYILKAMLTEKLYESFASQIARRESKNLRQEIRTFFPQIFFARILSDAAVVSFAAVLRLFRGGGAP